MDIFSAYLIGQMSSEVIRSGIVVGAGKSDVAMAEKYYVRHRAGNEEVRTDIKLLPL